MHKNDKTTYISNTIIDRKGARKVSDIPVEVIELLHRGQLETVNLTEWLAIDHIILLKHVLSELGLEQYSDTMLTGLGPVSKNKIMKVIPAVAMEWLHLFKLLPKEESSRIFDRLSTHRSDSVRCWAAYIVGLDETDLKQKLAFIRPFASDDHFGVREIAWMAVRDSVSKELSQSIRILGDWVQDGNAYIRRFAIESTRPQGVWAKHISELKDHPEIALPLLEAVKSDSAKYVQDSVGNWLNDASKTKPDWVIQVCKGWLESSETKETKRTVTRAQRSLVKKK